MHIRTLLTTSRFANSFICLYEDSSRALQLHSLVHHHCNVEVLVPTTYKQVIKFTFALLHYTLDKSIISSIRVLHHRQGPAQCPLQWPGPAFCVAQDLFLSLLQPYILQTSNREGFSRTLDPWLFPSFTEGLTFSEIYNGSYIMLGRVYLRAWCWVHS